MSRPWRTGAGGALGELLDTRVVRAAEGATDRGLAAAYAGRLHRLIQVTLPILRQVYAFAPRPSNRSDARRRPQAPMRSWTPRSRPCGIS